MDPELDLLIDLVEPTGTRTYVLFQLCGTEISAELESHQAEAQCADVKLIVDVNRIVLFDPITENIISEWPRATT